MPIKKSYQMQQHCKRMENFKVQKLNTLAPFGHAHSHFYNLVIILFIPLHSNYTHTLPWSIPLCPHTLTHQCLTLSHILLIFVAKNNFTNGMKCQKGEDTKTNSIRTRKLVERSLTEKNI